MRPRNSLSCFSPPVMIATFLIEISLAVYAIYRYHLNEAGKLIVTALIMLGLFQLAEYFVCGGASMNANQWSRIGYVAITTLPPLGLHLMQAINNKPTNKLTMFAYGSMAGFITYFLLSPTAFAGHVCTGNYVIFQLGMSATWAYAFYYYGWLITAMIVGLSFLRLKQTTEQRKATKGLLAGYAVFLIPTALVMFIEPQTRSGIPSIMCGFAVLFALILALYILPLITTKKHSNATAPTK